MYKKRLKPHKQSAKNDLGPDNNPYLAQIITLDKAKLGPDNNFTSHKYMENMREKERNKEGKKETIYETKWKMLIEKDKETKREGKNNVER